MITCEPKSSGTDLLRYLNLGKSIRSRSGESHIRNFLQDLDANPATHRLIRQHQLSKGDLVLACTELLDPQRSDSSVRGNAEAAMSHFSDLRKLDSLLGQLERASHGQAMIPRRAAIVECARKLAKSINRPFAEPEAPLTRANQLKSSISSKLLILLLAMLGVLTALILAFVL